MTLVLNMKPLRDLSCNITAEYKESELESGEYEIETRHENSERESKKN